MKKFVRSILILSLLFISKAVLAQQQETPLVKLNPISENLYEIVGGSGAGGGAYIGDDGILIIDAKMDRESVDATLALIRKISDKPIRYLVNTHSDGDHIWGNQFFPESVVFVSHENCRKDFFRPKNNGEPSDWNNPELAPFIPSVTFRHKLDIYLGSKIVFLRSMSKKLGNTAIFF